MWVKSDNAVLADARWCKSGAVVYKSKWFRGYSSKTIAPREKVYDTNIDALQPRYRLEVVFGRYVYKEACNCRFKWIFNI